VTESKGRTEWGNFFTFVCHHDPTLKGTLGEELNGAGKKKKKN